VHVWGLTPNVHPNVQPAPLLPAQPGTAFTSVPAAMRYEAKLCRA